MQKYDRIDAAKYEYIPGRISGDIEFYLEEIRSAGSRVLKLGCRTGRLLVPISLEVHQLQISQRQAPSADI